MKLSVVPSRYAHLVYGVIQSCVTCAVATGVSSLGYGSLEDQLSHWVRSWALSWLFMLPVVVLASPWIRRMASRLIRDE